ncbi:MAG: hypothetical protein ABI806_03105 [Candidatus Solibacter sp.]
MLWIRCLAILVFAASLRGDNQPPDLLLIRHNLETWLDGSDLAAQFESAKLRWVARPDKPDDEAARWLQWELRFKGEGTRPDEESERFIKFVRGYRAALDRNLVERLFFKLLHESGLRRTDIAVYVFVSDRTYSISFDPEKRDLVFQQDPDRMLRATIDVAGLAAPGANQKGTAAISRGVPDLGTQVQKFLAAYFAGQAPVRVTPALPEPDFAGVTVEGIRRRVLRNENYWEKLHVSIDIKGTPELPRVVCHISGAYAAGMGSRLPTDYYDMEKTLKYRTDLESFTAAMLAAMKTQLSAGR